ncbi:hypothetical protein Ancab_004880 [Ancistrocladus abbreviatus]
METVSKPISLYTSCSSSSSSSSSSPYASAWLTRSNSRRSADKQQQLCSEALQPDPFTIPAGYTWASIDSKNHKMRKSKSTRKSNLVAAAQQKVAAAARAGAASSKVPECGEGDSIRNHCGANGWTSVEEAPLEQSGEDQGILRHAGQGHHYRRSGRPEYPTKIKEDHK